MKKTASVLVCFFAFTVVLCFQAMGADKQQFCTKYADTAVKQYNLAKQHNLPGIAAPAWSNDRNGHYNWCMHGENYRFAKSGSAMRQAYLDQNITKVPTKKEAGSTGVVMGTAITLPNVNMLPVMAGTSASAGGDTSYLGCFRDQKDRDISGYTFNSPQMTKKLCMDTCRKKGFGYAGLQYSRYCFCGNSYGHLGKADNCNMACAGNSKETCGGGWANSVYRLHPEGGGTTPTEKLSQSSVLTDHTATATNLLTKIKSQKVVDFSLTKQILEKRANLPGSTKMMLSPYESPMFDFTVGENVSQAAEIGRGYDSLSGYPKFPALAEIPPSAIKQLRAFNTHSASNYVKNSEEYYDALGLSIDVSGGYMGFSASSSTKYEESNSNSRFTETYAAYADIETYLRYPTLTELRLNDTALRVLKTKGVDEFYRQYGDSFIYAIQYGAGFKGTISYDLFKKEEQYKFDTKASAGGWGFKAKVGYERTNKSKMESVTQQCELHNYGAVLPTPGNVQELKDVAKHFQQLAYDFANNSTPQELRGGVVRYTLIKYSNLPEFIQTAGGTDKLNLTLAKKLLSQLSYYRRKIKRMKNNLLYVIDKNNREKFSVPDRDTAQKLLTYTVEPKLRSIGNDIASLQRNPFNQALLSQVNSNINDYKKVSGYAPTSEFVKVIVEFPHDFRDRKPNQTMWNAQVGPLFGWPHISGDDQVDSSGHIDVNINTELEITLDQKKIYLHQKLLIHEDKPDHTRIGGKKRILVYTAPDDYKIVGLKQTRADYYHLRNLRGNGYIPVADVLDRDNGAPAPKADDLWEELHVVFDNGGAVDSRYVGLYGNLRMFVELEELAPKE